MKVKFVPQNVEVEIPPGMSVLHVAQDHGIYIKSVCKGVPSCAECRVRIVDGEHNVLPPGSEELSLIGTGHFIDRRRLSCQLKCFGDIVVDMTEQIAKSQGLISGQKKKKLAIKDDRIEDAQAYRADKDEAGSDGATPDSEGEEPSLDPGDETDTRAAVPEVRRESIQPRREQGPGPQPSREPAREPSREPSRTRPGNQSRGQNPEQRQHQNRNQDRNQNPQSRGPGPNPVQRSPNQQPPGRPGVEGPMAEGPRGDGPRRRRRRRRGPGGGGGGGAPGGGGGGGGAPGGAGAS